MFLTLPSPFPPAVLRQSFGRPTAGRQPTRRVITARPMSDVDLYAEFGPMTAPAAPTATKPAGRPGSSILASGIATRYGVASRHPVDSTGECYRSLGRVVLLAGCFDRSLNRGGRVGSAIRLLAEHDGKRELACTTDGGLVFIQTASALIAGLSANGSGPSAVRFLRGRGDLREFSVGFAPVKYRPGRDERGAVTFVEDAILLELSVVSSGNYPGCNFRVK